MMINLNSESLESISCVFKLKTLVDKQVAMISALGILAIGSIIFLIYQNNKLKNKIIKLETPMQLQQLNKIFKKLETRCTLLEKMINAYQVKK